MNRPIPHLPTPGRRGDDVDDDLFVYLLEELRIAVAGLRTPCPPLPPYTEAALRARLDAKPPTATDAEPE